MQGSISISASIIRVRLEILEFQSIPSENPTTEEVNDDNFIDGFILLLFLIIKKVYISDKKSYKNKEKILEKINEEK